MAKSLETLTEVRNSYNILNAERERLQHEAELWLAAKLEAFEKEHYRAVVVAVDDGHSITAIARMCGDSRRTPNRNRIYAIMAEQAAGLDEWVKEYPFAFTTREVKTASGTRTTYDIRLKVEDFGPERIDGDYAWRYDRATKEWEPVVTDGEPYPTTRFYRTALQSWLSTQVNPNEEE